jgi:hypothetical protein
MHDFDTLAKNIIHKTKQTGDGLKFNVEGIEGGLSDQFGIVHVSCLVHKSI